MRQLVPILLADLLLFTVVGIAVLAWAPRRWAGLLLPGAPAVGAATLAVVLQLTGLVTGARLATLVVLPVLLLALVVRSRRVPWWQTMRGAPLRLLAVGLFAGLIPAWFVIQPMRPAGAAVVQSSLNNDAFYFVSVTDWLLTHPALQRPVQGVDPPAYGNVRLTMRQGLRLGEEYDEAALATVVNHDPEATWSSSIAMWLVFLPGACVAAFGVLGLRRRAGVFAGVLAASSAVVAVQVFNQNSAGLLGILLAPLALALFARYVDRGSHPALPAADLDRPRGAVGPVSATSPAAQPSRPPLWLVALMIDGLVGSYTEYLPLLAPATLAFLLVRRPASWLPTVAAALRVLLLAIAVGPLVWWDALRSLVLTTGLTSGAQVSPFLEVSLPVWLARFTGSSPLNLESHQRLGLVIAAWMVVGLVAALWLSPARRFLACLALGVVAVVAALGSSLHYYPYGQLRAIGEGVPLLLLVTAAGWWELVARLRAGAPRSAGLAAILMAGAGFALFVVANTATTAVPASADWRPRTVDASIVQADGWMRQYGGPTGSDMTVLVPDFFTQLWTLYGGRKVPGLGTPAVYPDYMGVGPLTFDDGRLRRYVLVGNGALVDADPATIIAHNDRYQLLDTSRGEAVIAVGGENMLSPYTAVPLTQIWYGPTGRMLVAHTAGVHSVLVTMSPQGSAPAVIETLTVEGGASSSTPVVQGAPSTLRVPVGANTLSTIDLNDGRPPAAIDYNRNGYDNPVAVVVTGVHRG